MGDCGLIRFFKMLKKLEIVPKTDGRRRLQRLCFRNGQEYPLSDHSARWNAAATATGAVQMLWTAEAVEDLKKLALQGKSASHISAALGVGSRNAVIGKASRIGIKLNGGGGASVREKGRPRAARPQWATARYARPNSSDQGSGAAAASDPPIKRGEGRPAWGFAEVQIGEMRRLRLEDIRDAACRWPLGDPRSGEFAYCGLTPVGGQSYCAGHCQMAYRSPQPRAIARERGLRAIAGSWRLS